MKSINKVNKQMNDMDTKQLELIKEQLENMPVIERLIELSNADIFKEINKIRDIFVKASDFIRESEYRKSGSYPEVFKDMVDVVYLFGVFMVYLSEEITALKWNSKHLTYSLICKGHLIRIQKELQAEGL